MRFNERDENRAREMDFVSARLIESLVKCYKDPGQSGFWSVDENGMDILELSIRSGLLPPAAMEEPRRFRTEIRHINNCLVRMEGFSLVASLPGKEVREGARPTEEGVAAAGYLARPWWHKLNDWAYKQTARQLGQRVGE
ncbi:MAG: hypothetical protein EXR50_07440 [Dehalococcoidia bacterium]|nr:hypothetical protein [Dehalococcoidia bacterium]